MLIGEKVKVLLQTLSLYFEGSQEYILWKIVRNFLSDEKRSFMNEFLLKKISSKELEKLLVLMESRSPNLRKLSMLILSLLISNPLSKVYFLEKCGLPLSDGKILLTRFKYLAKSCKRRDPCSIFYLLTTDVLMQVKMAKLPNKGDKTVLFWSFNHNTEPGNEEIPFVSTFVDILENLKESESLDDLPDPIANVIGLCFEPGELNNIERSTSPISARDKNRNGSHNSRTHTNNIKIRDLSTEQSTLREKSNQLKEKLANYSVINKYARNTDRSYTKGSGKKNISTKPSDNLDISNNSKKSGSGGNKFSLNLSAVRKVSMQTKYIPNKLPSSKEGNLSDRWRGSRKVQTATITGTLTDRRGYRDEATKDREEAYNSIISHYKKINELNSSLGLRASTARNRR